MQQEAIGKAVNNVESAVKEKHIRNILLMNIMRFRSKGINWINKCLINTSTN